MTPAELDAALAFVVRHERFLRLEQVRETPFDAKVFRITVRGFTGEEAFEDGLERCCGRARAVLGTMDDTLAAAHPLWGHTRKADPNATTQPMARICARCGHAAHDKPCAEILTSSTAHSGPDDIGEQCGCGGER